MSQQFEQLEKIVNDLRNWLKAYPKSKIPSKHKKPLIVFLNKILDADELTDEEWKLFRPTDIRYLDSWSLLKMHQKDNPPETHLCPDCNLLFSNEQFKAHKKLCNKSFKVTKNEPSLFKKEENNLEREDLSFINPESNEHDLDGSYGLHNFKEDNGRFGSYPSYDNMDDESKS